MHADPEECQRIETDADAEVVKDACPQITGRRSEISFLISVCRFHDNRCDSENRFQPGILQNASLDGKKCMRIRNIDFRKKGIERPHVRDWWATVSHDNQSSLAAEKVNQQLEEGVNRKCLAMKKRPKLTSCHSVGPDLTLLRIYHELDLKTSQLSTRLCSSTMKQRRSESYGCEPSETIKPLSLKPGQKHLHQEYSHNIALK